MAKNIRNHHLSQEQVEAYRKQYADTGVFPNPYIRLGSYRGIVQSLIELGINEWHSFGSMRRKLIEIMSSMILAEGHTAWDSFSNRKSRNGISGKDVTGRILQNTLIMQRLNGQHPYGAKLQALCACIDAKREDGTIFFRLNTNFSRPEDVCPHKMGDTIEENAISAL